MIRQFGVYAVLGWQGIPLNRAMYCMSHNVDFATYSRTGVFWRGGLLHSVSGVSYWTLQTGIVGHLRPYANNGRIPLVILKVPTTVPRICRYCRPRSTIDSAQ